MLHLYRVWDIPTPSFTELMTIPMAPGHEFAGLVADGDDFHAAQWSRWQSAVMETLPPARARRLAGSRGIRHAATAAGAGVRIPTSSCSTKILSLTNGAVLTGSQNQLD